MPAHGAVYGLYGKNVCIIALSTVNRFKCKTLFLCSLLCVLPIRVLPLSQLNKKCLPKVKQSQTAVITQPALSFLLFPLSVNGGRNGALSAILFTSFFLCWVHHSFCTCWGKPCWRARHPASHQGIKCHVFHLRKLIGSWGFYVPTVEGEGTLPTSLYLHSRWNSSMFSF